jgi:uncharacterized membrane protein
MTAYNPTYGMPRLEPRTTESTPKGALAPLLGALALLPVLVSLHRFWAVQLLLIPFLLIIPGVILLRALRVPGKAISSFPVYIPCASIVVLIAAGLAVDLLGPVAGVKEPLRTLPLLTSLELICLALLISTIKCSPDVEIPWASLRPGRLIWPFIIPAAAIIGALQLNNDHGNAVAVVMLCGCMILLTAAALLSARLDEKILLVILYAANLALLWNYSLRGDLVYGFDIAIEYYDLHQTVLSGIWHVGHSGDAYGAMLSVTIMPAELHFLSGVSALMIFKLVYPAISALFPVAIFSLARWILSRTWAFVAAAFFVAQDLFAQELVALARQEIALVAFIGLLAAMLDRRLHRRTGLTLVALLTATMVLCHYSTTYVTITLLGTVVLLQWLISWFRQIPRITGTVVLAFALSATGALVWYGAITHSAISGLGQVAQSVESQGLDILPNQSPGENPIAAYLKGNTSTSMSAIEYEHLASAYYKKNDPFITPLPNATLAKYNLNDSALPSTPVRSPLAANLANLAALLVQQGSYLLAAIGSFLMVFRRRPPLLSRLTGILGLAGIVFLVLIRLSGTLAATYGQDRALLQVMSVLAIPIGCCLQYFAVKWRRLANSALALAVVSLAVSFVFSSGLLGVAIGGGFATNLANSGVDYERFDMSAAELAPAEWLGGEIRPGQLVYADHYAQLPLAAMTGININDSFLVSDVTPQTLNEHAWVYADQVNVVDGQASAVFDGSTVTYVFPKNFLDANYNLVYNDGDSEVFNR